MEQRKCLNKLVSVEPVLNQNPDLGPINKLASLEARLVLSGIYAFWSSGVVSKLCRVTESLTERGEV